MSDDPREIFERVVAEPSDVARAVKAALDCCALALRQGPRAVVASDFVPEGKAYIMRTSQGSFLLVRRDVLDACARTTDWLTAIYGIPVLDALPDDALPVGIFDGCPGSPEWRP